MTWTLCIRIVITYSAFAVMVASNTLVTPSKANISNGNVTTPAIKAILDPKRRNALIDEAFLEQKDILLDMLESKLKEVRDKKKTDFQAESNDTESNCELMPKNVDIILKGHGISGIGDTDVLLKYGENGNGTLALDATGISNVGKIHVELGLVDGNVHIPGLDGVFTGESLLKKVCKKNNIVEVDKEILEISKQGQENLEIKQTRRFDRGEEKLDITSPLNETSNFVNKSKSNDINNNNKSTPIIETTTLAPEEVKSTTEVVTDSNTLSSSSSK